MLRSKMYWILVIILAISLILSGCGSSKQQVSEGEQSGTPEKQETPELSSLFIGTAAPGGNWYTAGAKLAKELETIFPGTAIGSGPSAGPGKGNLEKVNEGTEIQMAMTTADVQYLAYHGLPPTFEKPNPNLRFVGTVETMLWQMVVPKASNIYSIKDLADKHINPGKIGYGDRDFSAKVLGAFGITFDSIAQNGGIVHSLDFGDGAEMMQDGHLDCAMTKGAIMPFIINLDVRPGIRWLPVEGPEVDELLKSESMIGITKGILKKGVYDGLTEDVPTLGLTTTLVCNADLSEDIVYKITKTIYESGFQKEVFEASEKKGFPKTCDLGVVAANATIPIHPGAKKYFEEKGVKLP